MNLMNAGQPVGSFLIQSDILLWGASVFFDIFLHRIIIKCM